MSAILVCLIQGLHPLGPETSQALELLLTDVHMGLFWFWTLGQFLQWMRDAHVCTEFTVPPRPTVQRG